MSATKPARRRDFDLIRVASMGAVVYQHVAAGALRQTGDMALWQFSNVLASLSMAAVPLFFMLSGALLMGSERTADPGFVLRRRLPRVAVPGLFWSLLVVGWIWYTQGGGAALVKLLNLPNTTVLVPYWFLYALVPMYLLSPLLKRMTDHLEERHWRYLLGLWAVLTLGLNTLQAFIPEPWNGLVTDNLTLTVSLLEGYLGYFLLGAYLERRRSIPRRGTLWAAAIGAWAVIALGTWWDLARTGMYTQRFSSYLGVFTMVLSAALFLLGKSYFGGKKGSGRALTLLSACSFGVYLAHPLAIKAVQQIWLRLLGAPPAGIPGQAVTWALTTAGCIVGVVLAGSVPVICYLVTGQTFSAACREGNLAAIFRRRDG